MLDRKSYDLANKILEVFSSTQWDKQRNAETEPWPEEYSCFMRFKNYDIAELKEAVKYFESRCKKYHQFAFIVHHLDFVVLSSCIITLFLSFTVNYHLVFLHVVNLVSHLSYLYTL